MPDKAGGPFHFLRLAALENRPGRKATSWPLHGSGADLLDRTDTLHPGWFNQEIQRWNHHVENRQMHLTSITQKSTVRPY